MIRARNLVPGSTGRTWQGVSWYLPYTATSTPAYYASAVSITAAPSGTAITLLGNYTRATMSVLVTIAGTFGATSFNVTLVGENQFAERVTEDIAFTANAAKQSLYAYRRIISATITAVVGTIGAATISIGHDITAILKVPMPAKITGTGTILAAANTGFGSVAAQPTFTVTLAPYWTINLTGQTLVNGNLALKVDLLNDPTVDPFV